MRTISIEEWQKALLMAIREMEEENRKDAKDLEVR
jgi:hypothetical protein